MPKITGIGFKNKTLSKGHNHTLNLIAGIFLLHSYYSVYYWYSL
jgi:hypothetical protein